MINIERVITHINKHNITKSKIMRDSGLSRVTIDKILEGRNVNVDTLEAFAKGLGVSVGFFFDDAIGNNGQIQNGGSNNNQAGRDIHLGIDLAEHDELIKLREQVKYLNEKVAEKDARIAELTKMNNYLMEKK